METKICVFEESHISFAFYKENNMMVNATEMAKVYGKYPKDFLVLDSTKAFIAEALKKENSPFLGIESENDLYQSRQKSGTWMHRVLAIKFAAWLNPKFELWVYSTIDELMFGSYKKDDETLKNIARIQAEITVKEKALEESPIQKEIDALRKQEKQEKRNLELRKKMRLSSFRSMFTPEEMSGEAKSDD